MILLLLLIQFIHENILINIFLHTFGIKILTLYYEGNEKNNHFYSKWLQI